MTRLKIRWENVLGLAIMVAFCTMIAVAVVVHI